MKMIKAQIVDKCDRCHCYDLNLMRCDISKKDIYLSGQLPKDCPLPDLTGQVLSDGEMKELAEKHQSSSEPYPYYERAIEAATIKKLVEGL